MSFTEPRAVPVSAASYSPVSTFGGLLIQALEPWMTLHLAWYLDAIGVMVDPLFSLVMDNGADGDATYLPGYGSLFNVSPQAGQAGFGAPTCPAADLPFVAQFVGVQVPVGSDDVTARSLVMAEAGLNRGMDAAVVAAAKRTLTGTQSVVLIRRTYVDGSPNPAWAGLVMRPEECASLAVTQAAVNAVKFGGVVMWYVLTDGWTISQMEISQTTITALEAAFRTLTGLESDQPGT